MTKQPAWDMETPEGLKLRKFDFDLGNGMVGARAKHDKRLEPELIGLLDELADAGAEARYSLEGLDVWGPDSVTSREKADELADYLEVFLEYHVETVSAVGRYVRVGC